jgi:NTP pyrophosphatase (non-canonical NTP hydrolase)
MNKEQYESVTKWQNDVFTKSTVSSCINHLQEEVQELKDDWEKGTLSHHEIADCFLLLFGVCNKAGMKYEDIVKTIDDKMEINQSRQWGEVNEKGYVKHIS